ncbi:ATP-grasp domain-containing protein [Liquorilactobacillus vini]|uniref:ATP-grasp domain-containing protein n=1 Tax=Liquorilactobacillus vini TaxID=238015 RepID=UPI00030D4AB1|nr:ATP-grasp domain-containing protein [Liquorilactobacillus vini]
MANEVLFPGDTLGIIGESPNGIMLAETAKKMGFKVIAYNSNEAAPTVQEADLGIIGNFKDKAKLQDFAERCSAVTYVSDQVPAEVIGFLERFTRIPQGKDALEISQDRLLERAFLEQININIAPYATIVSLDDVYQSVSSIGYPCIIKPIQKEFGHRYQQLITKQSDIARCADFIDYGTFVLEAWIPFKKELSVVVVKDEEGELKLFPIVENYYRDRRLFESAVGGQIETNVAAEIHKLATTIAENLTYTGALEIAFFLTENRAIYVKKIVPTIHPVGYVFDKATNVSMFEQHMRALAKMPLGDVELLKPTVMVKLHTSDLEALRTQWILKTNWHYRFYRYPKIARQQEPGYLLAQGDNVDEIKEQLAATSVWQEPTETDGE